MKQTRQAPRTHRNASRSAGFSLIEALVTVALLGVAAVGVATVMSNILTAQAQARNRALFITLRNNFETILREPNAWSRTIAQNIAANTGQMNCLQPNSGPGAGIVECTPLEAQGNPFTVWDVTSPIAFYNPVNPAAGFNLSGGPCDTFPSAECPIRYDLTWRPMCQNAAETPGVACMNTTVFITGDLRVDAGNPEQTMRLFGPINPNNFRLEIFRGPPTAFESVVIRYESNAPTGEGSCRVTPIARRLFNRTEPPSGGGIVTTLPPGGGAITGLTFAAGSYLCNISAPGFKGGHHRLVWREDSPAGAIVAYSQSAFANPGSNDQIRINLDAKFTLSKPARFVLEHYCTGPVVPATDEPFTMGRPFPSATGEPTTYTVIRCLRSR